MKKWKVDHCFAWKPVFIRNKALGFMGLQKWVWLRRYTRVWVYKGLLGRYRTHDTVLGHVKYDVPDLEVDA
jgi:hypothetical protein